MIKKWLFLLVVQFFVVSKAQSSEIELSINLAKQTGEYHNPYVAVWIENDEGKSVRTLVLWREGAKWLKDIRTWWRKVGRRDSALVDAITSATRPAGDYRLNFKASDDQGKRLENGNYTLKIEVVRENGGRAIIKKKFSLNGQAQTYTLKATPETNIATFSIKE
ncbi:MULTISPECIES: DUF2271 domain-containing protein [Pseudoalteromonas]|uniref:DUF2271 domain-containing protein n=1 Tax=Pseudoalteromonas aurantia 208 TaxID=1314867 RepID=A0ABR9EEN7_9GAMM|nr:MULTISPECIES: DUF2271 domain-containing protein [Pseudoalteromonas]MBE0368735.1 hypothetical protein [Pseudoalteromonas aurantia 208]MBQ4847979.1 DUF2271 domain-containing protein [Pseudoalteromonas sp. MMG005]